MSAKVKIKKGNKANLPTAYDEGAIYITKDTGEMFVDVDPSTRVQIGTKIESITVEEIDQICGNTDLNSNIISY